MIVTCTSYTFEKPKSWLYVTYDNGQTWNGRLLPGSAQERLFFLTPLPGLVSGFDLRFRWAGLSDFSVPTTAETNWQATYNHHTWNGQLQFLTTQVGWGVVTLNQAFALVKTTNGGYTWEELDTRILP